MRIPSPPGLQTSFILSLIRIAEKWKALRGMALYTFSGTFNGILAIAIGPLILRKIGLHQFGHVSLALSVLLFFAAWADFGLLPHLAARYSRQGGNASEEISNAFVLKAVLLFLALGAYGIYTLVAQHPMSAKILLGLYLLTLVLSPSHYEWFLLCRREYRIIFLAKAGYAVLYCTFILWWYFFLQSIYWIPVAMAAAQCVVLTAVGAKAGFPGLIRHMGGFSPPRVLAIFRRLFPAAAAALLHPLFLSAGVLLLTRMEADYEITGAYSVPHRIMMGWQSLIVPLLMYFIPETRYESEISLSRVLAYAALLAVGTALAGTGILLVYFLIAGVNPEFLPLCIRVSLILNLGIFLMLVRVKYVSAFIHSERYWVYFGALLVSALPVMGVLWGPRLTLSPVGVATLVCVPELLATLFFLWNNARATHLRRRKV